MGFKKIRFSLLTQITLLLAIVIVVSTFLVSVLFTTMIDELIESYMGDQAMTVAKLAAKNEGIITAFDKGSPSVQMQPIAETIREASEASYVTIANMEGIRYSHPNPDYIGEHTATSNEASLRRGESVIYKDVGISGPAIKAKTPILNGQGEVIGVSSVGFLLNDIEEQVFLYRKKIIGLSAIPLALGVLGAIIIARRVRKIILGLEPEEISVLFKEKEATLESLHDATITIDSSYKITSINKKARLLFGPESIKKGSIIRDSQLKNLLTDVLEFQKERISQTIFFESQLLIADIAPIVQNREFDGAVLTVRPVSEVEKLNKKLSRMKEFSENMRAQNHEFLNKLNTLYGLLRLGHYEHAISLISKEVSDRQNVISFLVSSVSDPIIAACLLGKLNRSKELGVSLEIEEESSLSVALAPEESQRLVSIIGNLIENALEAARQQMGDQGKVTVSFTDFGKEVIFDIEDNGIGISPQMEELIFKEGYTSKNEENHGLGLTIVQHALSLLNGHIYLAKSELGGTRFTIVVPKREEPENA